MVVGHRAGPDDAAVFGDDVAAEYDQQRTGGVAGRIEGVFPPVPLVVQDIGVAAVLVGVEVVHEQHVGTDRLVSRAARRISRAHAVERHALPGAELQLGPLAHGHLLAVVLNDAAIRFEVGPIRCEQTCRSFLGRRGEDDGAFSAGQRQVQHREHRDGALGQRAAPRQHLVPFGIVDDAVDGSLLEGCEGILRVFREEELHPFDGVRLQIEPVLLDLSRGHRLVDGRVVVYGLLEGFPLLQGVSVDLLHHIRDLRNLSNSAANVFVSAGSTGRSHATKRCAVLTAS